MSDLTEDIRRILKTENENGRFQILSDDSISLIYEIFDSYVKEYELVQPDNYSEIPKGEMIYLAAPTGAGKDSLVERLQFQNKEKNYVELNMDRFRQYFKEFIDITELEDKTFAMQTNELSFELYYVVQELLLKYYPGTNIIMTGTLRETDWIEEMIRKYESTPYTDYDITLMTLAVPKKDSQFSIISRYVKNVDTYILGKDEDGNPIFDPVFVPGSARYTNLGYANEGYDKFLENYKVLRSKFPYAKEVVHRRAQDAKDYSEDTRIFDSADPEKCEGSALEVIEKYRNSEAKVTEDDLYDIFDILVSEKDRPYFKEQRVLMEIVHDIADIFERQEMFARKMQEKTKKDVETPGQGEPGD